ncbi:hypothetical protein OAI08_05845 [Gammaproteobacteria bacterium]|nr:hypothetical protein [Gammaproteobacteria bacterium]
MSLLLKRKLGQRLLIVPDRIHLKEEITAIRVNSLRHDGLIEFAFDIAPGYAVSLAELYEDRHGDQLASERCNNCGAPMELENAEDRELHVRNNACAYCFGGPR